jgi:SAM-dependent methyltransferase
MRREATNRIRFVLEEVLPPALRDTRLFRWAAERVWGPHIGRLAEFRRRAPFLTPAEYEALYREHPRVHDGTDNSEACLAAVSDAVIGRSVCDVGCGTGHLLRHVLGRRPEIATAVGVDFVAPERDPEGRIAYVPALIEALPFPDRAFDTVVCTHVIEHILDYRRAIAELRRIAARRLIVVVPREREALYTFNPHFNFFPYAHSFLRAMHPLPAAFECRDVGRDIFYVEERGS